MLNAKAIFNKSMRDARDLTGLHSYLLATHSVPFTFDDLLRAQIIYSVSAFDKLIHDLIRIGMVQSFSGSRAHSEKFKSETITIKTHAALISASMPPAELIFEAEVIRKLGFMSFQDPDKLVEGLSLIWPEKHKWQKIAGILSMNEGDARTKLKLISMRRNAIAHESDIDPSTGLKHSITSDECSDITNYIDRCGNAIVGLVA